MWQYMSIAIVASLIVPLLSLEYDKSTHTYRDLLVSISPDLPASSSQEIIENVKSLMTEGSKVLHSTSRGWAHIKNVDILIPSTWTNVSAHPAQSVHEDAQIRVENSSPVYGDSPFTVQTGDCGDQGEYIQVSERFLTQYVPTPTSVFGPAGQVFVYEWSRFRYGVFSEHGYPGDPLYPMFYYKQSWTANGPVNQVKPNLCSNVEVEGSQHDMSGGPCVTDQTTGLPKQDCYFTASGPSSLQSSIMALPYLQDNDQWCDQTEERIHDDEIPTKHNAMCGGLSVMEVVLQHPDFQDFVERNNETDTAPQFRIIRPEEKSNPFVFVLDYSNSMKNNNRLGRMQQGVKRFLKVDAELDLALPVGVVRFSGPTESDTFVAHDIVAVDSEEVRQEIIDKVFEMTLTVNTCLGQGIRKGLQALKDYGMTTGGAAIFLTDGEFYCNGGERIEDVIEDVVAQNVRFCTIAFSKNADKAIEELARRTNGKAYFVADNGGQAEINNALSSCLDFLPSQPTQEKDTVIIQKTFDDVEIVAENVTIDHFTGRSVSVQIDYDVTGEVTVFNEFDDSDIQITGTDVLTYSYPSVAPGSYSITISADSRKGSKIKFLTLLVKSKAPENVLPITTNCWTNVGPANVTLTGDHVDRLVLYGQVTQGLSPVIAADLRATVSQPESEDSDIEVSLRDDGIAPDNVKNDGIYSAYFTDFKPNQPESRHSLVCTVVGTEETKLVDTARVSAFPSRPTGSTPVCCGSQAVTEDTPTSPSGPFTRSRSGGVITFGQTGSNNNLYPPGPIRDLTLGHFQGDTFQLSFTSPGADLSSGTIDQYTIFYSTNKTVLDRLDLSSSLPNITTDDLACNCTLDPLPPLERVQLTINMTSFEMDQQYYFRVLAVDQEGKDGLTTVSNVASIFLHNPPLPSSAVTQHIVLAELVLVTLFSFLLSPLQ